MDIEQSLKKHISESFKVLFNYTLDENEIKLQPTNKEFEGEFTFVCFPFLKVSKKSPEQTGEEIGNYLQTKTELLRAFNVVKGFLNLEITDQAWIKVLASIWKTEDFGFRKAINREVMVEYSSPNTNKPLHLGHLRNIFLGYSVAEILKANGYKVHKVQIINDRGIHICKSMVAWSKYGNGETPESSGIKGDKLVGKYYVRFEQQYKKQLEELLEQGQSQEDAEKNAPIMIEAKEMLKSWEEKDPEVYKLWKMMNQWVYLGFDETYKMMGVDFNKLYYESETFLSGREEVRKALKKDIFFGKKDGSVWVDLSDEGLDQKLLLRSDGTSVYMTQDIGTAILRFNDYPNLKQLIYTVGNEQEYHFKVLFLILKKLGFEWANGLHHLSYGMVDLPSGKMKSREGKVVDADDLMEEMIQTAEKQTKELGKIEGFTKEQADTLYSDLGLGALKFFLLKVDPKKKILFNPQESIEFQGHTGPFIQYTYARISAILRKATEMKIEPEMANLEYLKSLNSYERRVINIVNNFKNNINEAANELSPAVIAHYVYDLAKEYNKFYAEIPIFNEEDENVLKFRIIFSYVAARTIRSAMKLLGIRVPDRM